MTFRLNLRFWTIENTICHCQVVIKYYSKQMNINCSDYKCCQWDVYVVLESVGRSLLGGSPGHHSGQKGITERNVCWSPSEGISSSSLISPLWTPATCSRRRSASPTSFCTLKSFPVPLGRVPVFSTPGFGINKGLMLALAGKARLSEILQKKNNQHRKTTYIRQTPTVDLAAPGILVISVSELHL